MTLYTLGYQGLSLGEYITIVKEHPIAEIIDVRAVAWSRKPGFSKKAMQEGLHPAGIGYLHLESAGNPFRKDADDENILEKYRDYLREHQEPLSVIESELQRLQADGKSACLTCFEKEPKDCHRSIITEALLERNPHLHVAHLGSPAASQLSLVL